MPKKSANQSTEALNAAKGLRTNSMEDLQLIDDQTLAQLLDIDPRTPAQWRFTGRYKAELPVVRVGRCCRYRLCDVKTFIENQIDRNGTPN